MASRRTIPALVAHGGAGAATAGDERGERRRGMLAAARLGAKILQSGGSALDAVVATVAALEDHPLFNAGYGSLLNSEGNLEMDASVMYAHPVSGPEVKRGKETRHPAEDDDYDVSAGAVALVSRVRNPVMLARAVMERSPHILLAALGAERFARNCGMRLVKPAEMISPRARERWRARKRQQAEELAQAAARASMLPEHGTVGAIAIDQDRGIAAATSTGGVPGKLFGRIGDSAIIGAGTFAHVLGAASATGQGEAIILTSLCREAVLALAEGSPEVVAREAIAEMIDATGAEAGVILLDRRRRIGYAHNAASMQVARFDPAGGLRHLWLAPIARVGRDRK
ncbi:isoaspartyl peptidase/L-asparaginase family protein [Candidatus Binatus sp.]|uniref:isoaspartyl peptidase/L-asparaginase family protein n=1 Tax=Candidatus Binatus sp. TaxID=2811406 RepID=UPI00272D1D97|nr:isoaspartyl peptidase/L-asparaginase [Candidatus Binatus sp.]